MGGGHCSARLRARGSNGRRPPQCAASSKGQRGAGDYFAGGLGGWIGHGGGRRTLTTGEEPWRVGAHLGGGGSATTSTRSTWATASRRRPRRTGGQRTLAGGRAPCQRQLFGDDLDATAGGAPRHETPGHGQQVPRREGPGRQVNGFFFCLREEEMDFCLASPPMQKSIALLPLRFPRRTIALRNAFSLTPVMVGVSLNGAI
jgi:hypothetical protein